MWASLPSHLCPSLPMPLPCCTPRLPCCSAAGELIVEGGGFCGTRTKAEPLDLSAFDGIHLRVKSDGGQTFKLNIKTVGSCQGGAASSPGCRRRCAGKPMCSEGGGGCACWSSAAQLLPAALLRAACQLWRASFLSPEPLPAVAAAS
jgi:hypothetical protein